MKYLPVVILHFIRSRPAQRNLKALAQFLLALSALVAIFSVVFHYIMAYEGRDYSWVTGVYWTLTVMSTLGFGDITFTSDLGRLFSIVVLLSGTLFLLILLPFTFIQFFYAPWMEAQAAAMTPRELPVGTRGHVVLTGYGPVEAALVRKLSHYGYPYVVLVHNAAEALRLNDSDVRAVVGDLDDPDAYRSLRLEHAALLATTHSDMVNTNVAFTAREASPDVPIVATALEPDSADILQLAGCNRVLQLAEMMGRGLARRVSGRDAKSHVIGKFGELLIAEAAATGTPLVGRTLAEIRLPGHVNVNVVGVWDRGEFQVAGPQTSIAANSVLLLAGTRQQLDEYDGLFCIYHANEAPVVILGGGRVGQAAANRLKENGIDYRIVEKDDAAAGDPDRTIVGNAADIDVMRQAGLMESPAVIVTTHDDDMNIYLSLYCRRLRPDIQIISRATLERNVETLHRAGADFVLSYASLGANSIFNLLRRGDVLLLAEGLSAFQVPVPAELAGRTLAESNIRSKTKCNVIAVETKEGLTANPSPTIPLPPDGTLILIGNADAEERFLQEYVRG